MHTHPRTYIKRRPAPSFFGNVGDSVAPSCLVLITTCIDQVSQMKKWNSNGISTLPFTVLFRISMLIRTFYIIDWFTDLPTLLFAKLEKNKIENLCFLFPSFLIFILIMDQDIKNNKNVLWYINTVFSKLQEGI